MDDLPFDGGSVQPIVLAGHAELLPRDQPTVAVRKISAGYLKAMGIPLLRGRDVRRGEVEPMLVSRKAATQLWGAADPIGRWVTLPLESKTATRQIVGIVGDVKQDSPTDPATATVYETAPDLPSGGRAIVVRTTVPPASVAAAVTAAIHAIDADQPVDDVRTMDDLLDRTLAAQRFSAVLLGLFATVALALASVGIYSVLSYIVRGRSREIGIRAALGASSAAVVRMVVIEGMTPALLGIVLGTCAAVGAGRLLGNLVYGVSAADPATLAAVALGLGLVSLLASTLPAYRASRVDPLIVLRDS